MCRAALLAIPLAMAAIAAGSAIASCCVPSSAEASSVFSNTSLTPAPLQNTSLVQDMSAIAAMALPTIALLGASVRPLKERQFELLRPKGDADFLLDALEEQMEFSDTCHLEKATLFPKEEQCVSIKQLEANLEVSMREARDSLLLSEEEAKHYGNKHSNLVQMDLIDTALDLQGLEIPVPHGISHGRITQFLQSKQPEIYERWQALGRLFAPHKEETPFLQTLVAKEHLAAIKTLIQEAFASGDDFLLEEISEWLQEREAAGDFLMVRSTGAEDSREIPNAGGNESPPYVKATQEDVMRAAGETVSSYFGEASLQNRINAGLNPFEEELKLAVTTQLLIGEKIGGEKKPQNIPVSFVLFTNEPLYISDEKFRIMRVSASYGHGEGVVGNQGIATDTILLLCSESNPDQIYILYDNQQKPERLAPVEINGKIVLTKVKNFHQMVSRPALTEKQLVQIYRSGLVMEGFYRDHTDIEGVVKGGKVYFVQSRLVKRKPMLPTYLMAEVGSIAKIQAKSLVPGKASVLVASSKEDILFAETLGEAEKICAERGIGSYRLIVVSRPEPANSHPVVNFSNLGIPCLYVPDLQEAKDLVAQIDPDHPVAICMQTASFHLWDSGKANLQESIQEGFGVHPATIAISLPVSSTPTATAHLADDVETLLIKLRDTPDLQILGQISVKTALLKQEIARIKASGSDARPVQEKLQILSALDAEIDQVLAETSARIAHPKGRLELLFHIKALETILTGQDNGVGQYSLSHAPAIVRSIDRMLSYQSALHHPARCLDLLLAVETGLADETFAGWRRVLLDLEQRIEMKEISKEQLDAFRTIISRLQKTGALSQWISFLPEQANALQVVEQGLSQFSTSDLSLVDEMTQKLQFCQEQQRFLARFADPAHYDRAWEDLRPLIEEISSNQWLQRIQTASPTARLVACKTMERALTLLDDSLKTVKMSSGFSQIRKAMLFKEMLKPYFTMMKQWGRIVPAIYITNQEAWPLNRYMAEVESILNQLDPLAENALLPSREFSVAAAVLNAGTNFERHQPETLEDMLTLLHQNSIYWLSALNQDAINHFAIERSMLPPIFKKALKIVDASIPGLTMSKIGLEFSEEGMTVRYNVPLRNHSGQIDLVYDIRSNKVLFRGRLLGNARLRWEELQLFVQILQNANIFRENNPSILGQQEFTFSWEVPLSDLRIALREYAMMTQYSLAPLCYRCLISELSKRWAAKPELDKAIFTSIKKAALEQFSPAGVLFWQSYLKEGHYHQETTNAALLAVTSGDPRKIKVGLSLLALVVQKSINPSEAFYSEALPAAQQAMKSNDLDLLWAGQELWDAFIQKDLFPGETIQAAVSATHHPNPNDNIAAGLSLFTSMVKKGANPPEALRAAKTAMESDNVLWEGVELWDAFIQKDVFLEETIQAAVSATHHLNPNNNKAGLSLFTSMVKKGANPPEALAAAEAAMESDKQYALLRGQELWSAFIQKGLYRKESIRIAISLAQNTDSEKCKTGLSLLTTMLLNDPDPSEAFYSEAFPVAQKALMSDDPRVLFEGRGLWKAIIWKDILPREMLQVFISAALHMDDLETLDVGSTLLLLSVQEGMIYPEMFSAAKALMKGDDWSVTLNGRRLMNALIEKDAYCEEALEFITELLQSQEYFSADLVLAKLVKKGIGAPQALAAAQRAEQKATGSGYPIWEAFIEVGLYPKEVAEAAALAARSKDSAAHEKGVKLQNLAQKKGN